MNPKEESTLVKTSWYQKLDAWGKANRKRLSTFTIGLAVYAAVLVALVLTGSMYVILCGLIGLSIITFVVAWMAFCLRF